MTLPAPPGPLPQPLAATTFFICIDLPILNISYKLIHLVCGLSSLTSFIQHNVFKVHLCCKVYQYFFHFYGRIYYVDIPHFVYLLSVGHLGYFDFLSIMKNAAVNICVHIFVCMFVFLFLLSIYLGLELLGQL